jgi:hypothetical protein
MLRDRISARNPAVVTEVVGDLPRFHQINVDLDVSNRPRPLPLQFFQSIIHTHPLIIRCRIKKVY